MNNNQTGRLGEALPDDVFNQSFETIARTMAEQANGKLERDIMDVLLIGVQDADQMNFYGQSLPPGMLANDPNPDVFFQTQGAMFAGTSNGFPLCGFMVSKARGVEIKREMVDMEKHEYLGEEETVLIILGVTVDKRGASAIVRLNVEDVTGLLSVKNVEYCHYAPKKETDLQFWGQFSNFMSGFSTRMMRAILDDPTTDYAKEFVLSVTMDLMPHLLGNPDGALERLGLEAIVATRLN